jgi:hypothetical protein
MPVKTSGRRRMYWRPSTSKSIGSIREGGHVRAQRVAGIQKKRISKELLRIKR